MNHVIYFDEPTHKYYDDFGNPFTSTTTIVEKYYEAFDTNGMAYRCYRAGLNGNPKYKGKTVKQLKAQWKKKNKDSLVAGTIEHDYLEVATKAAGNYYKIQNKLKTKQIYTIQDVMDNKRLGVLDLNSEKLLDVKKKYPYIYMTFEILNANGYRILSEVGLFDIHWLVTGLIDIMAVKEDTFKIVDWKTNNDDIRFEAGYWEHDVNDVAYNYRLQFKKMYQPIMNLDDSVGNHYALQLSIYARLAEQFGLVNNGIILYHLRKFPYGIDNPLMHGNSWKNLNQVNVWKMPYLKTDVERMLDHHLMSQSTEVNGQLKLY
ncbi:hypothetical protein KAU11_11370 [Candidatus Babeliales bacterium]|nr:hypothetical protein [Candidatus Babeliales bacterium]